MGVRVGVAVGVKVGVDVLDSAEMGEVDTDGGDADHISRAIVKRATRSEHAATILFVLSKLPHLIDGIY